MEIALTLAQVGRFGFDRMDGWGWAPMVIGVLFFAALIGLIVWLIISARKPGQMLAAAGSARSLLDERYAKGEIEREDYLARKADLDG